LGCGSGRERRRWLHLGVRHRPHIRHDRASLLERHRDGSRPGRINGPVDRLDGGGARAAASRNPLTGALNEAGATGTRCPTTGGYRKEGMQEKRDTKGGAPGLSCPGQWTGVRAEKRYAAGRVERAEQRSGLVRARRAATVTAGFGIARAVGARDNVKRGLHAREAGAARAAISVDPLTIFRNPKISNRRFLSCDSRKRRMFAIR